MTILPDAEPVGSHARLFIIAGDETTELDIPDLLGDVYGDSAAELADSYEHLVIATDDSLIVRVGARGRMGISRVSLVDGSVQGLVDGPRCASPVGFVQGRLVFTTQFRRGTGGTGRPGRRWRASTHQFRIRAARGSHPHGGYMSSWLAATTNRFKAAVIENPVTDLSAIYGSSDIGYRFIPANFGGTPYEQLERFAAQSPLWQAHRCTTPCLFVVGTDDKRCPSTQAWSMHRVLCAVGAPPMAHQWADSPTTKR